MQQSPAIWTDHMRKGEFDEAWKFSDGILRSGSNRDYTKLPRHFQCIWNGTPLNGRKVLIRCYHGLGDTIQFIRYCPMVKKIASGVNVWAQPRLMQLLGSAEGIDSLLPLHDGVPEVPYDVDVEIMELAHIFRTTVSTIPSDVPYLHADPLPLAEPSSDLSVGIVWRSGDWDHSRSIDFRQIYMLFNIKGIRLYILQDRAIEAGWMPGYGIHPGRCTLYEHARIIRWLDLLITIDSMPAHLAGALNTPVWLLLPRHADWRWMENRSDSPWYPSMKIFRQEEMNNWEPVISGITDELRMLVRSRSILNA